MEGQGQASYDQSIDSIPADDGRIAASIDGFNLAGDSHSKGPEGRRAEGPMTHWLVVW